MTITQPDNQTTRPTTLNESGLTWNQRKLFHTLVNDGTQEWNAYTACLSVE